MRRLCAHPARRSSPGQRSACPCVARLANCSGRIRTLRAAYCETAAAGLVIHRPEIVVSAVPRTAGGDTDDPQDAGDQREEAPDHADDGEDLEHGPLRSTNRAKLAR